MEKLLCIIPARGGSKRIPHKNIAMFRGKPIISYSIEVVEKCNIASELMVSTDDDEIAKVAESYGAKVPFFRSTDTSNDHAGVAEALIEVVNRYKEMGRDFEYVLCVFATAPLLREKTLLEAYHKLTNHPEADSISTVQAYSYPPQRSMFVNDKGELEMLHPENYAARSQDLQVIYHDSCQFFIFRTVALLRDKKLYTRHTLPMILQESESQDIDTPEDWKIAEVKYDLLNNR